MIGKERLFSSNESIKNPVENTTIGNFSDAFKSIGEEYSAKQKLNPVSARELAWKQTKELIEMLGETYPIFRESQKDNRDTENSDDSSNKKTKTLFNVILYGTNEQKTYFIEMMLLAEGGDTEKAVKFYEKYFMGTDIWEEISWRFEDSKLLSSLQEKTLKTIDGWLQKNKMSEIYKVIYQHEQGKEISKGLLWNIPEKYLSTLLSLLPEIESICSRGDIGTMKQKIDSLPMDVVYKDRFFTALKIISILSYNNIDSSSQKKSIAHSNFYAEMEGYFWEQIQVEKERNELLKFKDTTNFSILVTSFPHMDKIVLKEKNNRLENLLENFIDKNGKVTLESGNFKKELLDIFRGSDIGKELEEKTLSPKEMLGIVASASAEKIQQTAKSIQKIDSSFSKEKLSKLQKEKPEEYKKLQTILGGEKNIDEKIQALQKYGITTNSSLKTEDKENYIRLVQKYHQEDITAKFIQSTLADEKKLALFEKYWSGEIKITELNAEIEKRDEEIQQTRQEKTNETKMDSAKTYDFNKIKNDFSRIPDNTVLPTKIDNISFTVRKDPNGTATVSYKWLEISGIDAKNSETANDNLNKAAETVRFLEKTWLDIFGSHIPDLLATIKNKQQNNAGTAIELKNGLSVEEKQIFLRYIAKIIFPKIPETLEKTEDTFSVIEKNGGLLRYLHTNKPEYVKIGDSLNIFAIKEAIKNTA